MTAGNFLVEDWQRRHRAAKEYVLHLQTVLGRAAADGSDSAGSSGCATNSKPLSLTADCARGA